MKSSGEPLKALGTLQLGRRSSSTPFPLRLVRAVPAGAAQHLRAPRLRRDRRTALRCLDRHRERPLGRSREAAGERGFELVETAAEDHSSDVVFDCTGHPSASPGVLGWAATGGVVVTVGAYPGLVGVDLQDLMFREITMVGARAYTPDDINTAVSLVEDGLVDAARFVTDVLPIRDGAVAIDLLRAGRAIKVLLAGPAA